MAPGKGDSKGSSKGSSKGGKGKGSPTILQKKSSGNMMERLEEGHRR